MNCAEDAAHAAAPALLRILVSALSCHCQDVASASDTVCHLPSLLFPHIPILLPLLWLCLLPALLPCWSAAYCLLPAVSCLLSQPDGAIEAQPYCVLCRFSISIHNTRCYFCWMLSHSQRQFPLCPGTLAYI